MKVAVLGATGHTGRMVVRALRDRGVDVLALGRNPEPMRAPGVEPRVADARSEPSLRDALRDADAVANLAGPFLQVGDAPARAALARGVPYADSTGAQAYIPQVRRDLDAPARQAGVPLACALAYEYAFSDLLVADRWPAGGRELHVLYRNRNAAGSAGTKKSILGVMGARSLGHEDGRTRVVPTAKHVRAFPTRDGPRTGVSFPGGEILLVPRHAPFRTIRTYVPARNARVARTLAPLGRLVLKGPILRAAQRYVDRRHRAPSNAEARGEIHLVKDEERLVVHTPDPYLATAEVMAEGIVRLANATASGALAPSEALPAREMLDAMARRMPTFRIEG
jgi:short subunit dehydrogenase-like uncharacterized protein